jgi:hypothetical protein
MFIDEPEGELVVRPKISYQLMLGTFSAALLRRPSGVRYLVDAHHRVDAVLADLPAARVAGDGAKSTAEGDHGNFHDPIAENSLLWRQSYTDLHTQAIPISPIPARALSEA